ncbi:MAG: TonB family protein [Candidatus Aminicenantes bacterium]|nr:TonB family protein [Candidatus Aminicenantes bacterium]
MNFLYSTGTAEWILNSVLRTLLLSGMAVIILRFLRPMSAPLRSMVCLLALFSLFLIPFPPLSEWGNSVFSLSSGSPVQPSAGKNGTSVSSPHKIFLSDYAVDQPVGNPSKGPKNEKPTRNLPSLPVQGINFFGLIWGLGMALLLTRIGWGAVAIRRIKREASPVVHIRYLRLFRASIKKTGCSPEVKLLQSNLILGPQAYGIWDPVIFIPYKFFHELRDGEIRGIFLHELSHVKHHDTAVGFFQRLIGAVFWWNPLLRKINADLSCAREEISDNQALLQSDTFEYARCLIHLAEHSGYRKKFAVSSSLVSHHLSLTERVQKILSKERTMDTLLKPSTRILAILAAVLCLGLAASARLTFVFPGNKAVDQKTRVVWNTLEKSGIISPQLFKKKEPAYPPEAVKAGITGTVILEGSTDKEGLVNQIKIFQSENDLLKAAAGQAVLGWEFKILKEKGESSVYFYAEFDFDIAKGRPMISINLQMIEALNKTIKNASEISPIFALKKVKPVYPRIAQEAGVEGTVILELTTDIYGRVKNQKILRSIPLLDQAAVNAVRQWRYKPAIIDGKKQEMTITVAFAFNKHGVHIVSHGSGVIGDVEKKVMEYHGGEAEITIESPSGKEIPKLIKIVYPPYPEIARQAKVVGPVILIVSTNTGGRIKTIRSKRSVPLLDQAVFDAVKQWVFDPIFERGKPQTSLLQITVNFTYQ